MEWMTRIRNWLRGVSKRSSVEREMNAEMQFHIESYADDLVRRGMAPEQALRQARLEFGAIEARKEECRASLGLRLWDELRGDLRYSLRTSRNSPAFTAAAIATLALGIGANTAIFTLVDAVLLRMAPVSHPEQLYQVQIARPDGNGRTDGSFTNPLWEQLRATQDVFAGMASWGNTGFNLAHGGAVQPAQGLWVSGDYFATLGVPVAAGRLITNADDRRGCPAVAVLSYGFWQDHYGGSAEALGSTLSLDSKPFQVIGVTARGFYGLDVGQKFDVAVPICAVTQIEAADYLERRSTWWLTVVGRIKPELTPAQMNGRLAAVSPAVMRATVPPNWKAEYQQDYLASRFVERPAGNGISWPWSLRDKFREPLTVLMGVVGIVLLIACANVAALLLARGAAQRREIAVRLALGARRLRIVRQVLLHALTLSALGAACGLLIAQWGTRLLVTSLSTQRDPVFLSLRPDWRIAGFTAAVAVMTAILFGLLPAFRSTRVPLMDSMRSSPMSQTERRSRLRQGIVAAQIALSLVLLIVAGLFLRSFGKLLTLDPGFDRQNVLLVEAALGSTHVGIEQQPVLLDEIQERLAALPGVLAVGHSNIVPLSGGAWNDVVHSDVPNLPQGQESDSLMNFVSPGYFSAMRMPLLAGRDITAADTKKSPPVVVVNRAFARKFFGTAEPIGHLIRVEQSDGKPGPPIQVVGVVADAKYRSMREEMKATAFFPLTQIPQPDRTITFAIRTAARPEELSKAVVNAVAGVNHEVPLKFSTLERQVDDAMVQERLLAMLSAFFGAVALLLAMIGLYGTVSYQVTLRKSEFGIRMALGAQVGAIVRLVIREVLVILTVGIAAGIVASIVTTRVLQKLLFDLGAHDVLTILSATLALSAVALLSAFAPARRAARVDPMIALRCE